MAQTSIHIEPCNIGSSERHNLRSKELDYIRPDLSHLNESWTKQEIMPCLENIKARYKQTTGQNMQKKATPIREGVVVIEPGTSMQQLKKFADKLHERWGIKTIQIHIHKDEGYTPEDKPGDWKPNLHAHMIFDWTDDSGKSLKLKKQDLAEMQTVLAECLNMERGVSSDRKHLNSIQYKAMKEAERVIELENRATRAKQITAHLPELEEDYREALEQYDTARNNLDQAAQHL
ncbi:plasmid recombination protein, partial [Bacteroides fragilis]